MTRLSGTPLQNDLEDGFTKGDNFSACVWLGYPSIPEQWSGAVSLWTFCACLCCINRYAQGLVAVGGSCSSGTSGS